MLLLHKSSAFPLLLITIFGLSSSINCQPQPIYSSCLGQSNDAATDDFNSNLGTLLDSLSSKASINTFYKDTSNGIYSLFLCRGDVSTESCQVCVRSASQEIRQQCPSNKTAIIWYDECMLHYSNANFFGVVQTIPTVLMWNAQGNSTPGDTDFGALGLIYTLIDDAANNENMYAADHRKLGGNGNKSRYGLVQCSRDLNSSACSSCLAQLNNHVGEKKIGWRIFSPSCYIRYEEYSFFQTPTSPLPQPTAPPPNDNTESGGKKTVKIVVITLSSLAAVAAILGSLYYLFACRKRRDEGISEEILLGNFKGTNHAVLREGGMIATDEDDSGEMHYISLATIQAATDCFSDANKLGEGGFGPVYKGKLPNGKEIAVKRLSLKSNQGLEEFRNEVMLIIKLQHKNLVRLLGYCLEGDEKLLVYEYMANTSLDAFLFDPKKCKELDWEKRANIINGTARGLLYLHEDSRLKIIHRDMKASNVLLDDEMNPKISDFGTARIFGNNQIEASTERVVGTFGYMAPEYALEGLFSMKSDVYSFGILMLEIVSGKKNRGFYDQEFNQNLLSYAWQLWNEGKGLELIDPNIIDACPVSEASRWIHIALLCVQDDPADRPTMSQVVLMLGSKSVNLPQPSTPPYSAARFVTLSDQSSTNGSGTGFRTSDQSSTGVSV